MNDFEVGMEDLTTPANLRAYAAELVGTMFFVLMGTAAIIVSGGDLVLIALAHGLGFAMMVYLTSNISGGHINPAVTLAMIVTRNIKVMPGVVYIGAQLAGAAIATGLLYLILFNDVAGDFGAVRINAGLLGNGGGFLLELVLTFVLVGVIIATTLSKQGLGHMAPIVIGLTLALIHFVAFPLTGASVNPARMFGPALVSNAFDSVWLYVLGPALGAVAAGALWHHVFLPAEEAAEGAEAADDAA